VMVLLTSMMATIIVASNNTLYILLHNYILL
jgi:hypothetical protein